MTLGAPEYSHVFDKQENFQHIEQNKPNIFILVKTALLKSLYSGVFEGQ